MSGQGGTREAARRALDRSTPLWRPAWQGFQGLVCNNCAQTVVQVPTWQFNVVIRIPEQLTKQPHERYPMTDTLDLDQALRECRSPLTKSRLDEAVRCFNAGAYRASVTSIWTAILYDLHEKLSELSNAGDSAAEAILKKWNRALQEQNVQTQQEIERTILETVSSNLEIIDATEKALLNRVREDRNLCAHPAMLADGTHFSSTPELVRSHLSHAVRFLFTQRPTQGKSILAAFKTDVESPGFPTDSDRGLDYVTRRYLDRTRDAGVRNMGVLCGKVLISGEPSNIWPHHRKVIIALRALQQRRAMIWGDVEARLIELVNNAKPEERLRCVLLCSEVPGLWGKIDPASRTALIATVENADWDDELTPVSLRNATVLADLAEPMRAAFAAMTDEQVKALLKSSAPPKLWDRALEIFSRAGSFRGAEARFSAYIAPFQQTIQPAHLTELARTINGNGQIWDAALLPSQTLELVKGMPAPNAVTTASAQAMYEAIDDGKRTRFEEVWAYLADITEWAVPDDDEMPF